MNCLKKIHPRVVESQLYICDITNYLTSLIEMLDREGVSEMEIMMKLLI